jgi:hypothetical protein
MADNNAPPSLLRQNAIMVDTRRRGPAVADGMQKAKALLRKAFNEVEVEHKSATHIIATSLRRMGEAKIDSLGRADAAKFAVTGLAAGGLAVATVLTGGLAIGAVIAVGGAAYAIKKGIDRIDGYARNAELRARWIQLGAEYTHLSSEEQMAKREKLSTVSEADAKDCIRKCVVHMRKAIEHYNNHIKNPSRDAINSCDQAVARAKPLFKFVHEYDKFRSYLLPNLLAIQTMISDYEEMAREWSKNLPKMEQAISAHLNRGSHHFCDDDECYENIAGSAEGASRAQTANFDLEKMREQIVPAFNELVSGVALSKSQSRTSGEVRLMGEKPEGETRWKKFRGDLVRRYDEPSRGRQVRHFVTNRNMATTKTEKGVAGFNAIIDVGGAAGGPFLNGVISSVAKGGVSAGTQVFEILAGAGIGALSNAVQGDELRSAGAVARDASSLLRPEGVPPAPLDSNFKSDEDVKNAFKDDAVAAQKLINKISIHWKEGMDALEPIQAFAIRLNRHPFRTCGEAKAMCLALAEFCHHFSKMEKYLLAYYFVVMRLVGVAKELAAVEAAAYNQIGAIRPQVASEIHHGRCDSVCYGPKIVTTGVIKKTVTVQSAQVHKPL